MDCATRDIKEESDLVRKARRGDQKAFETLYHRHARAVYTLAFRLTGNAQTAEDVTQDAFLRMAQFLNGFRSDAPLRPWLKRVASNLAIDLLRKRKDLLASSWEEDDFPVVTVVLDDPDLSSLMRRLPPLVRTLVWLHQIEGWSHQELAARFGKSPSWSKSIISRGLAHLRVGLDSHEHIE